MKGLITVAAACRKYRRSPRVVRRWLASGSLKTHGIGRTAAGQKSPNVLESEFRELCGKNSNSTPAWIRFKRACREKNVHADKVLWELIDYSDIDASYHRMRLALEPSSDFLLYLSGQKPLDQSFEAQLAQTVCVGEWLQTRVRNPDREKLCLLWRRQRMTKFQFKVNWFVSPLGEPVLAPLYLREKKIQNAPEWAKKSLISYRLSETFVASLKSLVRSASNDAVKRESLKWLLIRLAAAGRTCSKTPEVSDARYALCEGFGMRPQQAKAFAYAFSWWANTGIRRRLRYETTSRAEAAALKNKVFGLSRAARVRSRRRC